jgi:Glyoxalase-like domain
MPLVTYKDFCIDAVDAHVLGRFWGDLLALDVEPLEDGDTKLTGPGPRQTVWVNSVPEPVTVKQRVHLDVWTSFEETERLGATHVETLERWTVYRDPEGGELCVFPSDEPAAPRRIELVVDCGEDARPITNWWANAFGVEATHDDRGFSYVEGMPDCPFAAIAFVPVPEPKTVKNRIHLDVFGDVESLMRAGATVLAPLEHWTVMADPEGNEFCAFAPRG